MKLFISSEQHYSASYCFNKVRKPIMELLEEKIPLNDYGNEFESIGIITIILPKNLIEEGFYPERKYISRKNKFADIRLQIDLERFISENEDTQRLLYIKNILESIRVVNSRKKEDFDGENLEKDILELLNVTKEEIDKI